MSKQSLDWLATAADRELESPLRPATCSEFPKWMVLDYPQVESKRMAPAMAALRPLAGISERLGARPRVTASLENT